MNAAAAAALIEDGQFGSQMENAVRGFQICIGITNDEMIGKVTWAKLEPGELPPGPLRTQP